MSVVGISFTHHHLLRRSAISPTPRPLIPILATDRAERVRSNKCRTIRLPCPYTAHLSSEARSSCSMQLHLALVSSIPPKTLHSSHFFELRIDRPILLEDTSRLETWSDLLNRKPINAYAFSSFWLRCCSIDWQCEVDTACLFPVCRWGVFARDSNFHVSCSALSFLSYRVTYDETFHGTVSVEVLLGRIIYLILT